MKVKMFYALLDEEKNMQAIVDRMDKWLNNNGDIIIKEILQTATDDKLVITFFYNKVH